MSSYCWGVTNKLTLWALDGSNQIGTPATYGRAFAQGEIAQCPRPSVSGTPLTHWQADVKNRWPDGSVKFAIMDYESNVATAGTDVTYNSVSYTSGSSCHNESFLDKAGLLTALGAHVPKFVVTANGTTVTTSLVDMLNDAAMTFADCKLQYWQQGDVVTTVIVQDCTATTLYDFGWTWNGTTMSTPKNKGNGGQADKTASLHPIFVISAYRTGQVRVDFILENEWSGRFQDQNFSGLWKDDTTTLWNSTSAVGNVAGVFTMIAGTNFRRTFWLGTAPPHVRPDHNFSYLISTKLFPYYDLGYVSNPTVSDPCTNQVCPTWPSWIATDLGEVAGFGLLDKGYDNNTEGAPLQREPLLYYTNSMPAQIRLTSSTGGGAMAVPTVSGGTVTGATLILGGSGYSAATCTIITYNAGSGATCTATISAGAVTAINITAAGSGYLGCGTPNGACAKAYQILTGRTADGDTITSASGDTGTSVTQYDVIGYSGMWNNMGNVPYHMRQSTPNVSPATLNNFYCPNWASKNATLAAGTGNPTTCTSGVGNAIGRPTSRYAYPLTEFADINIPDTAVGTRTLGGYTGLNAAHWLDFTYDAYLITGDWYYYQEELLAAAHVTQSTNPDHALGDSNYFFSWAAPIAGGMRIYAWAIQAAGRAASIAVDNGPVNTTCPDGTTRSVEACYFQSIVNSNLEIEEGILNKTGTNLTPTVADSTGSATDATCANYDNSAAVNRWNYGRCNVYSICNNVASTLSQDCRSGSSHALTNTQHSLIPGECSGGEGYHQGTMTGTASTSPTIFTTTANPNNVPNGVGFVSWGGTLNWAPINTNATVTTGGGLSANQFSLPVDSHTFGAFTGSGQYTDGLLDLTTNTDFVQDWMGWMTVGALGHLSEIGTPNVTTAFTEAGLRLIEELRDPGYSKYMSAMYISPYKDGAVRDCTTLNTTTNPGYSSWADALLGFPPPTATYSSFRTSSPITGNFACSPQGYSLIVRSAASYLTRITESCPTSGTCSGLDAWNDIAITNGGAAPYNNNSEYQADAGCGPTLLTAGSQSKFALMARPDGLVADDCSISSPTAGATVSGSSVTLNGSGTPGQGSINNITYTLDGSTSNMPAACASSPCNTTFNSTLFSNGSHTLAGTCTDDGGGSGTIPSVSITISNGAALAGGRTGVWTGVEQ